MGGMFDGLGTLLVVGGIALLVAVPLAIWKVIDLILWVSAHVTIN